MQNDEGGGNPSDTETGLPEDSVLDRMEHDSMERQMSTSSNLTARGYDAVRLASAGQTRSDSILSRDSFDSETEEALIPARNMSVRYMEEASMEASLGGFPATAPVRLEEGEEESQTTVTTIAPSGRLGRRQTEVSSSDIVLVQSQDLNGFLDDSQELEECLIEREEAVGSGFDESMTRYFSPVANADKSEGSESPSVLPATAIPQVTQMNAPPLVRSKSIIQARAPIDVLVECGVLLENKASACTEKDALFHVFRGFSEPEVSLLTVQDILDLEEQGLGAELCSQLPDQPTINMLEEDNHVVSLLTSTINSRPVLLMVPPYFAAAFLRILVRLLTHETDEEYNASCGLVSPTVVIDPKHLNSPESHPDHSLCRPHVIYNSARFQCTRNWVQNQPYIQSDDCFVPQLVLKIWESVVLKPSHQSLVDPLARLLGVLCIAGVNPRLLRQMTLLSQSVSIPTRARLAMIRCLCTSAVGSARPMVLPKLPPQHFFSFGKQGMMRSISGLSIWPFRNDFGVALWFRAEQFGTCSPVLFSSRAGDGGGIVVRLVPLAAKSAGACTVEVCIYDSGQKEAAHRLKASQCVLLPRVWYYLAVRHTRSRLKGVFSLSTRQQVSIMLDGKVMQVSSLPFPKITSADHEHESILQSSLRRVKSTANLSLDLEFGVDFDGQTGAVYVFHDNVSDAALRALYEVSGGNKSKLRRSASHSQWDSRRSDIVRKSRALETKMTNDDADEIVLGQRRASLARRRRVMTAAVDLLGAEDAEKSDVPMDLHGPSFGSKVFVAWDPARTVGGAFVVESHIGAHLRVENAYCWSSNGAQDVLASIGGIQSLIPVFRSIIRAAGSESNDSDVFASVLPCLITMLSSFVVDHDENAREFLRCGALDILEQVLFSCKQVLENNPSRPGVLSSLLYNDNASKCLLLSILKFRSSCEHYVGLETKVFSRLLFNVPLWSGSKILRESSLAHIIMPVIAKLTRQSPAKVRDCLSLKEVVSVIHDVLDEGSVEQDGKSSDATVVPSCDIESILLGVVFDSLGSGTSPRELAPFLNLLSVNLDAQSWESLPEKRTSSEKHLESQRRFTVRASTLLYMLFQVRPVIPGLFESFSHCCGSAQGGIAWIMSAMVNSVDDVIRSIGIRCMAAYLEITSNGPDIPLSLEHTADPANELEAQSTAVSSSVRRGANRLSQLAKDLTLGTVKGAVTAGSGRLTTRVVFKLMWHLLRSLRAYLGARTRGSLIFLITHGAEEGISAVASLDDLKESFIVVEDCGYIFNLSFADRCFEESGKVVGKSIQDPLAIGTVLRLLRYVESRAKDEWIADLLQFASSNRSSVRLFATVSDWHVSLFQLLSDTMEATSAAHRERNKSSDPGADQPNSVATSELNIQQESLEVLNTRIDNCLNLFARLLGHIMREGGEKALSAVEGVAALQRVCLNGHAVFLMIVSRLYADLFDHGTLLDIGSISAEDWKGIDLERDSLPLRQSARLVTDAILSNGTQGLDLTVAVRSWRSLRHLTEITVALISKNSLDVASLFDYRNQIASAVDEVSRGLHGIRLSERKIGCISAAEYGQIFHRAEAEGSGMDSLELVNRRVCITVAAQVLVLLDAFMFPASLDASLPASQLHGLALVRDSEPRLGPSQGPLLCSAIRLSIVLLCLLEPSNVALLQCASRLRCLLLWALELLRERASTSEDIVTLDGDRGMIDRLILASVLHCHRALSRCAAVLIEAESAPLHQYFKSKDEQKKHQRRILRVSLELRDIVNVAFRSRNQVLKLSLSSEAYEELKAGLENVGATDKAASKESFAREFLSCGWVSKFQDIETRSDLCIPEQVSMDTIPLSSKPGSDPSMQGFAAVESLSKESENIVKAYEKALNVPFELYLENQRKWTETDAVRDLEYEGDNITSRLSNRREVDEADILNADARRRNRADFRWNRLEEKCVRPWKQENHWKLAEFTDRVGRRMLLVSNPDFNDHMIASYEGSLGRETEHSETKPADLSDVMRRNAEAFIVDEATATIEGDITDDDASILVSDSENSSEIDPNSSDADSADDFANDQLKTVPSKFDDFELDSEWDKIGNEELANVGSDGDIDGWARAFIWGEDESVVARFEPVMIVSLRSYVLGKILLTTQGIYFRQIGDEINGLTKLPVKSGDVGVQDAKDKRWRLARLTEVHGRRYMLRQQALELFFSHGHELFLNFTNGARDRDRFHAKLRNSCKAPLLSSPKSLNPRVAFRRARLDSLWRKRKITNFEYLMALNRMAGRSFNDITQYPVLPWVLADYTSESINLSDSRIYRDLSKPVGALNPDRLAQLLERYSELELFGFSEAEKFLYGSHYSSPGIVLHYLIRQEPFTSMAIDLQSGRFDCPDRLFFDIAASWTGCLTSSSDMKELIPEFFTLPEMFMNTNKFPLGTTQGQIPVDNVRLPPWANGSAYEFVRINRLALESEYVSNNLHHWIDLIFGYKQRGAAAEAAHNIFHHLSYEGSVDLDKITDEVDRIAAESHVQNFGQTPSQLITVDPHVSRLPEEGSWSPLLSLSRKVPKLRCYTPSKQFGNTKGNLGKGGVLKLEILSDTIITVFGDMSIATYKWYPGSRSNRLRMDRIREPEGRLSSTSRPGTKRGSAIPPDLVAQSGTVIGNGSVAVTLGGRNKEGLRRNASHNSSRLISGSEVTLTTAEASALIVSCGYWDHSVRAYSAETLKVTSTSTGGHRGPIRCLAIGKDGGLMVTGGQDCTCRVWVVDHPDMAVALSDGYVQTALGSSNDGADALTCCHCVWGHDAPISAVAIESDLDVFISGDISGRVCVHTLRRGEFVRFFYPSPVRDSTVVGSIKNLAVHPTGTIAIHTEDRGLHTYTINGVKLSSVDAEDVLHDMKFTSDGEYLVSGGDICQVLIRTAGNLEIVSSLDLGQHGPIRCIAFTPDNLNPIPQYLFIGSDDGAITIVDEDVNAENESAMDL